jgi:hypothetical protein
MWPLPRLTNNRVQIILGPEHITCYWIALHTDQKIHIKAMQRFDISLVYDTVCYNLTELQKAVMAFITTHHLQYAYSHLIIDKPLICELLVQHRNSYASLEELIDTEPHTRLYEYSYVGPDMNQSLFYVCSIAHSFMLQLRILHATIALYMQSVCTPLGVQFNVYKKLHGSQFSQAQLVRLLDKEQMLIPNLFKGEKLQRYFDVMPDTSNPDLVYALSSFLGVSS